MGLFWTALVQATNLITDVLSNLLILKEALKFSIIERVERITTATLLLVRKIFHQHYLPYMYNFSLHGNSNVTKLVVTGEAGSKLYLFKKRSIV
jgi:hypothetical protein